MGIFWKGIEPQVRSPSPDLQLGSFLLRACFFSKQRNNCSRVSPVQNFSINFAVYWRQNPTGEFADKMNSVAKYVISTAHWKNRMEQFKQNQGQYFRENFQTKEPIGYGQFGCRQCQLVDMLIQNQLIDGYPKRANESFKSILKLPDSERRVGRCL